MFEIEIITILYKVRSNVYKKEGEIPDRSQLNPSTIHTVGNTPIVQLHNDNAQLFFDLVHQPGIPVLFKFLVAFHFANR